MFTLHEDLHAFMSAPWSELNNYLSEQNVSKSYREEQKIFYVKYRCVHMFHSFLRQFKKGDAVHTFLNLYIQQSQTVSETCINKASRGWYFKEASSQVADETSMEVEV